MLSWSQFEKAVREYANYIWDRVAEAEHVAGIDLDCVLKIHPDSWVIIEITQEKTLQKIRKDITNIGSVRHSLLTKSIHANCFIVCDYEPTDGMRETGSADYIKVVSFTEFQKMFFDFPTYKFSRMRQQFGSAIDPISGQKDTSLYIPVSYINKGDGSEFRVEDIAQQLLNNKKIVLLGDFGTGKSRCFQELYQLLTDKANDTLVYPIAIDLRDSWGLINSIEIIRRHFSNLGIDESHTNNVVKAFNGKNLCFLLDGFDEIGSRPWSDNPKKLEELRQNALQGVKDLIVKCNAGVIISGRDHYFNSNDEMFKALGIRRDNSIVLQCKDEFSYDEFLQFVDQNNLEVEVPEWIPKKPLILKVIASFEKDEIQKLFIEDSANSILFWFKFIDLMCERDAKIHAILDGEIIKKVLAELAKETRNKQHDVGPLGESEIVGAFTRVTGVHPNEQATVMLQRLPGLGRVNTESGDRSFIDMFVLDGLRGLESANIVLNSETNQWKNNWMQPLRLLGQRVLCHIIKEKKSKPVFVETSIRMIDSDENNKTLISDIIASLARLEDSSPVNYNNRILSEPNFGELTFEINAVDSLTFIDGTFEQIKLGTKDPKSIVIKKCSIEKLSGVSSRSGLPTWIEETCEIDTFESVDTLTAIKKSGLTPSQTILVSILIKVYRQYGNGRLAHTLTKGLPSVNRKLLDKVIHYLTSNNVLLTSKDGNSGDIIYKPSRDFRNRVEIILSELHRSSDEIWKDVSKIGNN
ncbi:hypothetical protein [Sulfuricurvum sp.]|uniref:NACHT domain-containing protein n=1 Tax=Sulfuricurvum sp. TaxID=2025608 RepID=UPI002638B9DD|nr:hypothetical protein [Sulfuricurvum sp.]MDD3597237.1 hypothetical protein [Sulfuricurvum sp.]